MGVRFAHVALYTEKIVASAKRLLTLPQQTGIVAMTISLVTATTVIVVKIDIVLIIETYNDKNLRFISNRPITGKALPSA